MSSAFQSLCRLGVVAASVVAMASCEEKELCFEHPHAANISVRADWTDFAACEEPTGMTVRFYPRQQDYVRTVTTNDITYAETYLRRDVYDILVFNQSPSEFGTITFADFDHFDKATAYAAPRTSAWYVTKATEQLVHNPEWLGIDTSMGHSVTQEMLDDGKVHQIATLHPTPLTKRVRIIVHLKNIYNLASTRASLGGLAAGCLLSKRTPTAAAATQIFENWTMTKDDNPVNGVVVCNDLTFGLPSGHKGTKSSNMLSLSFLLVDQKTVVNHDYYVGDLIKTDPTDSSLTIEISVDEPLPDVKPGEGGGGFDASVDEWGETVNIDIDV